MATAEEWRTSRRVAIAAVLSLTLAACGGDTGDRDSGEQDSRIDSEMADVGNRPGVVHVKEVYDFESLAQMVATTPVVVEGTVVAMEPGRKIGTGDGSTDDGAIQMYQATLQVSAVLHGPAVPETIVVEESGLVLPLLKSGDEGVFFVYAKEADSATGVVFYGAINSEGRFLVGSDGFVEGGNDADAWVQELESLTLEGLRVAIEEAESQVRSGEIQPMGPSLP